MTRKTEEATVDADPPRHRPPPRRARPEDQLQDQLQDGLAIVRANVQQAPYASLGLALGVGLILGGGMWRVLARSLVGTGARLAVALVVPALIERNQNPQQEE